MCFVPQRFMHWKLGCKAKRQWDLEKVGFSGITMPPDTEREIISFIISYPISSIFLQQAMLPWLAFSSWAQ